jgi:uncharacterized membrane protein
MFGKSSFLFLVMVSTSLAATIHGTIYDWSTLEPLEGSIVQVNSTPAQQLVSRNGNYSFELALGDYLIVAKYYENNSLAMETEEKITIKNDGKYLLDLIMFPAVDIGEPLFNETEPNLGEEYLYTPQNNWLTIVFLLIIMTTALLFIASKLAIGRREDLKKEPTPEKPKRLPKEAAQVLEIIKKEQRLTQKELRKKLPWSEAKVSLIVSDLEDRGLIKKIKKGRGNILKID